MSIVSRMMADAFYTTMAHNAAFSEMNGNIAMTGLLKNAGSMNTKKLAATDKKLALQHAKDNFNLKIAEEMLKKEKKKKLSGFDTFA